MQGGAKIRKQSSGAMNIRINLIRGARGDCGEIRKQIERKKENQKEKLEDEEGWIREKEERLLKKHFAKKTHILDINWCQT